ncbi:MAG: hypothetical protein PVG34_01500 [Desulfobacterales bacterium]
MGLSLKKLNQSPSGTRSPTGIFSPGAHVSKALGVMVSPARAGW